MNKSLIKQIKELHSSISKDSKNSLKKALKLGGILQEQKKEIGFGNFTHWVEKTLPFSERTAQRYLAVNRNKERIEESGVTTLYEAYELLKSKLPYQQNSTKKDSTVYTPKKVSEYLYKLISPHISPETVLDPGIGKGSLSMLWRENGASIIGSDIESHGKKYSDLFLLGKFEEIEKWEWEKPDLIICNPPFNAYGEGKLYPEIFLRKMIELFGEKQKIVLVVPMGFRLNQRVTSERWNWLSNSKCKITSIISLPIDCFKAKFHTEILIFNIPKLKPHYFLYEEIK